MSAIPGDVCARCGFQVIEVLTLSCRCDAVAAQSPFGTGVHLLHVCEGCFFPRFEPLCADPAAQMPGTEHTQWKAS